MVLKALARLVNDDFVSQGRHMITQGLFFPYSRNMRVVVVNISTCLSSKSTLFIDFKVFEVT